jgi:hypothetical protein
MCQLKFRQGSRCELGSLVPTLRKTAKGGCGRFGGNEGVGRAGPCGKDPIWLGRLVDSRRAGLIRLAGIVGRREGDDPPARFNDCLATRGGELRVRVLFEELSDRKQIGCS